MIEDNISNNSSIKDNSRYKSGLLGEKIALKEMEKLGFKFVCFRYKTKEGEIDLIVEDKKQKLLVFVEVKRRKEVYDYENVISKRQWNRIKNASSLFLEEHYEKYKDYNIRFDAFICFTNSTNTIHIENIFID